MHVSWCPLIEEESGFTFVVSPRTGKLLAYAPPTMGEPAPVTSLAKERLADAARVPLLPTYDEEQGYLGQPHQPPAVPLTLALRAAWLLAEGLARWAPLDRSFRLLERLARVMPPGRTATTDVLDCVAFAERSFYHAARTQACLPRTLLRFFLLRANGYPVEANIGVWVPTELMHAWVSLHGVPLGEEREEVMHYQACLRFTPSGIDPTGNKR